MRTVRGTAEVNSWGGYEKQYQIRIDPEKLIKHSLTFDQVVEAVQKNNYNVGGGNISQESGMLLVQGLGRTTTIDQLRQIVITAKDGVPIRVADIGEVVIGHEIRRGAVTANGQGEVVLGLGFMLMGENSHEVTWAMKDKLRSLEATLPANVQVKAVYDRTELVDFVIDTVRKNLFEGGLLVVAVLFAFLGNLRAAAIVALAIPLSMLFAFTGMYRFGIAASLLSLGAIDFGLVVDSSVVMIENCVRHLAHDLNQGKSRLDIIRDAAVEVRRPTMFGELIIMIVYLPILTLEGIEGKMFRPMALTVIFALVGSMVLSLTLMPVLASLLLPKQVEEREPVLMRIAHAIHYPILQFAMHHKLAVMGFAASVLIVAFGMIAPHLGSEFVPELSEGGMVVGVIRLAGTDLNESIRANTQMEKTILAAFPDEVENVWSRIGTAEVATDPMGIELTDIFITLKPRSTWKKARTQAELTDQLEKVLREFKGIKLGFSQPIEMRVNEMVSGVRADLGVKLFGDDFDVLVKKGQEIEAVLRSIQGAADVSVEQVTGQPMLQIKVDQDQVARYGVSAQAVLDLVESIGSKPLGEVVEGQLRFPLIVRLPEQFRASPQAIGGMLVSTATGERIPLSRLASVEVVEGPSTITREWGQRRITITCNVRGRDLGTLSGRVRWTVREPAASADALADRRPAGPRADLLPALHDLSQRRRRLARLHGHPVRLGRRHLRPLAARHAVFDLGGGRLHRHVRRGRARRHDPRVVHPAAAAQGPVARRRGHASRGHSPAARPDDDARGQSGLPADGVQRRDGRGSATAAGDGGHWRRDWSNDHVAPGVARAVSDLQQRRGATRSTRTTA
jgi:cobalt-zinc-cadmium resistance protein CzcA